MATTLAKKLQMRAGQRVLILNSPPGYVESLVDLPEGVEIVDDCGDGCDFVHLFVTDVAELERLGPQAVEAVTYDGLLWVSYPKRSSKVNTDITRDHGWEVMDQAGLRPIRQISIDDVWSALRFRPREKVGK